MPRITHSAVKLLFLAKRTSAQPASSSGRLPSPPELQRSCWTGTVHRPKPALLGALPSTNHSCRQAALSASPTRQGPGCWTLWLGPLVRRGRVHWGGNGLVQERVAHCWPLECVHGQLAHARSSLSRAVSHQTQASAAGNSPRVGPLLGAVHL